MASRNTAITILVVALLLLGAGYMLQGKLTALFLQPHQPSNNTSTQPDNTSQIDVVAENLNIPWEIRFLPSGDMLVTERSGTLLRIGDNQTQYEIQGVKHTGEGGLLGMALHPDFQQNQWLYLYLTTETDEGTVNRVERYKLEDNGLTDHQTIITDIPGAPYHDGGRIDFGPDGLLYITTGDAGNSQSAQDRDSLAGKILRLNPNGSIPDDNPFNTEVYSYGHRNPQGLTWDEEGRLWSTEHGRSGVRSGFDELNLIEKGNNYGWPVIQGSEDQDNMEPPILHSGPDYTWAPASAKYWNGSIFFGGLRGSALYEAQLQDDGKPELKIHLLNEYGRIRAVRLGPDGNLYISTSNTDGRGNPVSADDRIIRINPAIFR